MKQKNTVFIQPFMVSRAAHDRLPFETAPERIRRWGVSAALVAAAITFPAEAATSLPADVQRAIYDRLSGPDMQIEVVQPPESGFVHYSRTGMAERLDCDYSTSYKLHRPASSVIDNFITVGECKKNAVLNERYGGIQAERFRAALGTEGDKAQLNLMGLETELRPRITRKPGKTEISLQQMLISGIGGVEGHGGLGFETILIVPISGQRVFLVQGTPPDICNYDPKREVCSEFPTLLEELAEIVQRTRGQTDAP